MSNMEYISGHRWKRINMVTKYIVHMHISAKLKAYWVIFSNVCTNMGSVCTWEVGHTCEVWHTCSGAYANNIECLHTSASGNIVDSHEFIAWEIKVAVFC